MVFMNNLAASYAALGNHSQAVETCHETLRKFELSFRSESQDILREKFLMVKSYLAMGDAKDTLKLGKTVLGVCI